MVDVLKIVTKNLSKARHAYNAHLADKHNLDGQYLVGRLSALQEVLDEVELYHAKAKVKKARG